MTGIASLREVADQLEKREAWNEAIEVRGKIAAEPAADFWDRFFHARALLYSGQLDKAQELITTLPNDRGPAVVMLKADLKERLLDYTAAEQLWAQALNSGAPPYWCLFGRARSIFNLGRLDEAKKVMAEARLLPEWESRGQQFAESLDRVPPAGALVDLSVKKNSALEPISFDDLLIELLHRVRTGESIAASEHRIAWAQDLEERLSAQLNVHQNRFSIQRMADLFSSLYNFIDAKPVIRNAAFLDLGSGSHNPLALGFLFVILGARSATAVDLDELQEGPRAFRAMARLADILLTEPARVVGDYPISSDEIRKNLAAFDLSALRQGDGSGIDRSRLSLLRESASALSAKSGSIDVITSNSFLEHIEDVDAVIAEMARVTAPGGYGIHNIDATDHASYDDASRHPLAFLCESAPGMMNGSNRLRPLEFVRFFESHGFALQQFVSFGRTPLDPGFVAKFAEPWRSMPAEVLENPQGTLVVRRQ